MKADVAGITVRVKFLSPLLARERPCLAHYK